MKNQAVQKIIENYFEKQKLNDAQIFNVLRLYIYKIKSLQFDSDLHVLGKLLQPEQLRAVTEYFNGDVLKTPKKSELLESTFLAICFYLKEIQGWDWLKIREFINLPEVDKDLLSSISIGKQINNLKESLGKDIMDLIKQMDVEKFEDTLNEVVL